jgi:Leucine-rich repeat (LRR) protein
MEWSQYNSKTCSINLSRKGFSSFNFKGAPEGLKEVYLSYNQLTSFSWEGAPKGVKTVNLIGNTLTDFSWEGAPKRLKEVYLSYNQLTSFSWEGAPEGLEEVSLSYNQLTSFSWEGAPKGLEKIYISNASFTTSESVGGTITISGGLAISKRVFVGSTKMFKNSCLRPNPITCICFRNSPPNLKHVQGFDNEFKEYLKSKECRLDRAKYTRPIADMITHANLVESNIPVLKKYACRDYYKVINDFKEYSKER